MNDVFQRLPKTDGIPTQRTKVNYEVRSLIIACVPLSKPAVMRQVHGIGSTTLSAVALPVLGVRDEP